VPNNHLGYLGVDSVHRSDQDGIKGGYQINAVDCITQYEGVATCERIREAFLIPALEALLQNFPFVIHGFPYRQRFISTTNCLCCSGKFHQYLRAPFCDRNQGLCCL
jgi:hypothetical protein